MEPVAWHSLTIPESIERLRSTRQGLTSSDAASRLREVGPNDVEHRGPPSALRLLAAQFWSPLVAILLAAAAVSWLVEERTDAYVIFGVVLFNAFVGFWQERRSGQAMAALKSLTPQEAHILRDGVERLIPAAEVVPGDVILLEAGTVIPADGRLIEAINLKADEAVFTGESLPVEKSTDPVAPTTPLADRHNSGWRGTTVVAGRGHILVVATGMQTRLGAIVAAAGLTRRDATPFQRGLGSFARRLTIAILGLAAVVFLIGLARDLPASAVLLLAISLVVSLIPEGLPVVITLTLAWGMWRLAARRALIRKLTAVETLGSVTTIAADKTGTLTAGQMMVETIVTNRSAFRVTGEGYDRRGDFFLEDQAVDPLASPETSLALKVGALCNDARFAAAPQGVVIPIGDPTELALLVAAEKAGLSLEKLHDEYPRVGEFPFDFALRYMVTIHRQADGRQLVAVKGAPRQVLALCQSVSVNGTSVPFDPAAKEQVHAAYEQLAARGLRGLAVAVATVDDDVRSLQDEHVVRHLTFLGLLGMRDAIRPEAKATVEAAQAAGIRVLMLTGDYRVTAQAVATEIGLLARSDDQAVLDGQALADLDDAAVSQRLPHLRVLSRVAPEDKLRIARLLKARGEVVAMTGDGINDVPALTEANVGVAIGAGATDAAKEASDMIVTDGNLSSIVAAVAEGRTIFANIQRALHYLLASNATGLLVILASLAAGLPLPLLPTQIIWLNAVTDPFMGLGLAREPQSPTVLQEPPRPPREPIVTNRDWTRIAALAIAMTIGTFGAYLAAVITGAADGVRFGVTLTALALNEWLSAFAFRAPVRSLVATLRRNRWLAFGLVAVVLLQAVVLYVPPVAEIFHVATLSVVWALIAVAGAIPVVVVDLLWRRWRHV